MPMSPNLDLLRAVAVLCVFFAHLYETIHGSHTNASHHLGQLGVIFFFVHTSLVLMQSLGRNTKAGVTSVADFYMHRFFRVYPLSITCVIIAYFVPGTNWTLGELFTNLSLTQNLVYGRSMVGGLWTLPLEVQMYLVLPLLFFVFRLRPIAALMLLWIACALIAQYISLLTGRLSVIEYAPCFLSGVIAWRLGDQKILPNWLWPVAIAGASIPWLFSPGNTMVFRWISCLLLGLGIPLFKEATLAGFNLVTKSLAKYSYGIYLTHVAALQIAFHTFARETAPVQAIIFISLAILFPLLAYHVVEGPMINFGRNILARRKPVRLGGGAEVAASN